MPELPDVESFKNYFKKTALNKKVVEVECSSRDLIKKIIFKDFKKKLIGKTFQNVFRRGKFLIIKLREIPEKLVLHFGMTGGLHYTEQDTERTGEDRFTRLCFKFNNGYELRWLNMRKLGKVYLIKDPSQIKLIKEMGPEPLSLSKKEFLELLKEYSFKNIKSFLLDQTNIAGIGNIYSDEIMFQARINPHQKIEDIKKEKREKLYKEMKYVLKKATEIMNSDKEFPKSWLIAHRHQDMKCPRNKNHNLKREIIAGRPAYFCPICQKLEKRSENKLLL